jgi:XTP/dITP diphosphohydrolase
LIRLYCATGNPGKLGEFRLAAAHAPVSIELLPGYSRIPPPVEDGATFEENAALKALHYARWGGAGAFACQPDSSKIPAPSLTPAAPLEQAPLLLFADDSGLEVDALGGEPGVRSARYCGHHGDDDANNRVLLGKLRGAQDRTARFVCAIALVEGGRLRGVYRGAVEGAILHEPRGSGGFGYDPLFYYPPFDCTFGEAGAREKFSVSHRGQALRAMLEEIAGARKG